MAFFFDDWVIDIAEFDAAKRPGVALRGHSLEDVEQAIHSYEAPFVRAAEESRAAAEAERREHFLVGAAGRRANNYDQFKHLVDLGIRRPHT